MEIYYFTHGSDAGGGWTKVVVAGFEGSGLDPYDVAVEAYSIVHPRRDGFVACASIYGAAEFEATKMRVVGNYGRGCVETITVNRRAMA